MTATLAEAGRIKAEAGMTRFVRDIEQHRQTIGLALVLMIGVVVAMLVLSAFLPALGNPIFLAAGALVALGLVLGPLSRS